VCHKGWPQSESRSLPFLVARIPEYWRALGQPAASQAPDELERSQPVSGVGLVLRPTGMPHLHRYPCLCTTSPSLVQLWNRRRSQKLKRDFSKMVLGPNREKRTYSKISGKNPPLRGTQYFNKFIFVFASSSIWRDDSLFLVREVGEGSFSTVGFERFLPTISELESLCARFGQYRWWTARWHRIGGTGGMTACLVINPPPTHPLPSWQITKGSSSF
jgi:hypothetical protein